MDSFVTELIAAREAQPAATTLYPHPSFSFPSGQASAGTSLNRGAGGLDSGIPRALHQMERMAPDPSRYHHAGNTSATVTALGGAAGAAVTVAGPVSREYALVRAVAYFSGLRTRGAQ